MASCLVLVDNLLVCNAIDHAHVFVEHDLCCSFVAGFNRFDDLLDRGTQSRAQTCIVGALLDCLTCTLSRLCAISHGYSLNKLTKYEAKHIN